VSKLQLRVARRPSARCSLRRSLYLLATSSKPFGSSLNRRCRLSCLPCLLLSVRLRLPSCVLACGRPTCLYSSPPSGWTCLLSCHDLPRSPLPLPAPTLQRRPSPVGASSLVGHHRHCCCPDPLLSCCTVAIRHAARVNCSSSRSPPPLVLLPTGHAPYDVGSWAVHNTSDDEIAEPMPTRHEENKLIALQDDLREVKSASKKLVAVLLGSRIPWRGGRDREERGVRKRLRPSSSGKETKLSAEQRSLLKDFAVPVSDHSESSGEDDDRAGFVERALRARRSSALLFRSIMEYALFRLSQMLSRGFSSRRAMFSRFTATASSPFAWWC
jgi:hypothetical protein